MAEFRKIGPAKRFADGRGRRVKVDGQQVAVFWRSGRYHAFSDACPHMGTSLADGRLTGNFIQCHWHEWKYDLDTGRSDAREWACIHIYQTKIEDDELWVLIPDREEVAADNEADEPEDGFFKWDPERNCKIED